MRAASRTTYDILATVEIVGLEIGDEELAEQFAEEDVQGHSAEIYDVLCQCVGGEALQLVRTVDDMEWFRAWSNISCNRWLTRFSKRRGRCGTPSPGSPTSSQRGRFSCNVLALIATTSCERCLPVNRPIVPSDMIWACRQRWPRYGAKFPGCDDEKEDARRLATLPMRVGGLGLRSATRVAPGAFGASWADVLPMVHERLPTVAEGALEGEDALQSCLGELQLAARSLDRHGFIRRPQWRAFQSGARPPRANDIEPGEWAHFWQHYATSPPESTTSGSPWCWPIRVHHTRPICGPLLGSGCSHAFLWLPHPTRVSHQSKSFLRVDLGTVASAIPCDRCPMRVRRRLGLQGAPQGCVLALREIAHASSRTGAHTRQGVQGSRSIGALQREA